MTWHLPASAGLTAKAMREEGIGMAAVDQHIEHKRAGNRYRPFHQTKTLGLKIFQKRASANPWKNTSRRKCSALYLNRKSTNAAGA